ADEDAGRLLEIYLNDHRAGATAGRALAERSAGSNQDTALGQYLTDEFLPQLAVDRQLAERVRGRLGARDNPGKQFAARAGELIGRLKLNGQIRGYSPLSRILELEALVAAVSAKRQLWRLLATLTTVESNGFEDRIVIADQQRDRLEEFHRSAVVELFGSIDVTAPDERGAGPTPS
ncbi:MAG: hypothetical protein WKF60_09420, partial [Ilumatobacter sp.]